jgi:hypothetical protein
LVHRRDDGHRFAADERADVDHCRSQPDGVVDGFHESAAAGFDVKEDFVGAGGDFLAHHRRSDEGDAFDCAGDVAQGVEFAVGRRDVRGLAGDGHAQGGQVGEKLLAAEGGAETGDGLKLVDCAAGKTETTAGHFRHRHTGRCDQRRKNESGGIGNAAGAVFVDLDTGDSGQVDSSPGIGHGDGEGSSLGGGHAAEEDGHEEGGDLIVGDFAAV